MTAGLPAFHHLSGIVRLRAGAFSPRRSANILNFRAAGAAEVE